LISGLINILSIVFNSICKIFSINFLLALPLFAQEGLDLLETKLLINTQKLKSSENLSQRRAYQEFNQNLGDDIQPTNDQSNLEEFQNDPDLKYVPESISSTFEASNDGSIATSPGLEKLFDGKSSTEEDFFEAIKYLISNKTAWELSDGVFLSATKSIFKSYLNNTPDPLDLASFYSSPDSLLSQILPQLQDWNGQGPGWVKRLSQVTTEALMELNRPPSEVLENSTEFTKSLVRFISDDNSGEVPGMLIGVSAIEPDRETPVNDMRFGGKSGFDPENFRAFQQLAVGLTQGFLNSKQTKLTSEEPPSNFEDGPLLNVSDFAELSEYENSIIESSTNGLLSALLEVSENDASLTAEQSSLYAYDSIKSLANGFVLASTVYATSEPEYLAEGLYIEAAERTSRGVAHATISHEISQTSGFSPQRLAESVSHGSAMGGQLATVLPKSMEFVDNWEIFSQSRRDVAQAIARGSSFGAVDAAASFLLDLETSQTKQATEGDEGFQIATPQNNKNLLIERVSQGSSLGAMVGTTGLAIYYPTDQLVPIINFTAQGSAYGSINSKKLDSLNNSESEQNPATEEIQVAIARQTAIGSSMGAVFEPSVLLGLRPDTKANDKQTTDNISAASFGAVYGAIQGRKEPDLNDVSTGTSSTKSTDEISITEITQSSKQGTTEGALVGAKLALGLDDSTDESLSSKGVILKAISKTNAQAASEATSALTSSSNSNSGTPLVGNPLRTSSKDMLLLMRKYGINPRYTNAATMFKRPVVPQLNEPPQDLISEENNPADGNESYADTISNASPI
jgi:hypothetical protein